MRTQAVDSCNSVVEALARSLEAAARYNSNDAEKPDTILWSDQDSQWWPIIPQLRRLMPQLLTMGDYNPEQRTGPAIWLRCVLDGTLDGCEIPEKATPIIYLPGVGRQELRAIQECPDNLKPLVELQYRGVCWTQKNGRDWTVDAFLVAEDGGLGLNVARDAATRWSMLSALTELATTSIERLKGRILEAEDFDKLFSDDPTKDLLLWLNDPEAVSADRSGGRWSAFKSRCKADFKFDPDKDGELVAAELLVKREGPWTSVWERFAESPALYQNMEHLLRKIVWTDMFMEPSSLPQNNEGEEASLRQELLALENTTPSASRGRCLELENKHAARREWVWAKLDQAPLAKALEHLAVLATRTASRLGGASVAEMSRLYIDSAWEIDAAALAAMAAVKLSADAKAVSRALNVFYRPWLESAADHLQELARKEPLPDSGGQSLGDLLVEPGGVILFADGLRFDVSQNLAERMREKSWSVTMSTRWAGLPTVTATAKPAVSPVTQEIKGLALGDDFLPVTAATEQPLTTDRFRKLLVAAGYQYLNSDETGDTSARAWTENGELDKLGHSMQGKLAGRIEEQVDVLVERIESLFDAGWREIRIVTDHGWLWLPGGLPKAELPKYLTQSRWARCAAIKGDSKVESPTVQWHWNPHERVAVAPGIACFFAGNEYAHGGLSLQESLIPVIQVTADKAASNRVVQVASVSWAGMRCRIQVEAAQSGLSVDLRTKINDPESSVSTVRIVDARGLVSILVEDGELEGTPVVVAVLDTSGHVIAKQPAIIGGMD